MKRIWIAAAALCGTAMAAEAQEYVVIESSVAAMQPGARLTPGAKLAVPAKGRIVLMGADGGVVGFDGPFDGAVPAGKGGGASPVLDVVPALFNTSVRTEAGVVRAATVAWRSASVKSAADVMAVDATDGGDSCVAGAAGARVTHDPSAAGTMTVHAADGDASATLAWAANMVRQPWPGALPLADGKTYLFEQPGVPSMALATIHVLPAVTANEAERVAQLAKAGCNDQARLLLTVLAKQAK